MNAKFQEHDLVTLAEDIPEEGLKKGDAGTIVHVYRGGMAFEVEFPLAKSQVVTVTLSQIE